MSHTEPHTGTPQTFESMLDTALHDRAHTEPLLAIEPRILSRIAEATSASSKPTLTGNLAWRWPAAAIIAAALCTLGWIVLRPGDMRSHAPRPAVTQAVPVSPGPPASPKASFTPRIAKAASVAHSAAASHGAASRSAPTLAPDEAVAESTLPKLDTFPSTTSLRAEIRVTSPLHTADYPAGPPAAGIKLIISELRIAPIPTTTLPTTQELP